MAKKSLHNYALIRSITTIHGTSHFSSKRGRSLRLWCCVMITNIFLTVAFVMVIKQKFNENQIVTQINANCKVNQVPFPAVSICNFNSVSLRESANIAQVLKRYKIPNSDIESFFNALPVLRNYNKNTRNIGNFSQIMTILKHHYFTMDTIMEEVHQKCEDLLLYCSFNRKPKKCADIFSLIKTYEGYCCAFNYAALNDASEVPLLPGDGDLEYYDDQNQDGSTKTGTIISTSESGSSSGLRIVINVEKDDYPSWSSVPYYGAKAMKNCYSFTAVPLDGVVKQYTEQSSVNQIMLTDPNDYPETSILYRYITPGDSVEIKVDALVFQSESDLRRVDPEKRGCWFYDEVVLEHTDRYSFETCNTECRMKTYLESCGCIPFKYPRGKSVPICELQDLKCLNNVTALKSKKEMNCKPICYMECRDKKYSITSDLEPFLGNGVPSYILQNQNISELASLQVYFGKSHCNCYKLTLLIDFNYFIATYGGVFSLSFGGSILTLAELAYLIIALFIKNTVRCIATGIRNRRKEIKRS